MDFKELNLLEVEVLTCKGCQLCKNKTVAPTCPLTAKYAMLFDTPIEGASSQDWWKTLWMELTKRGFSHGDFLIMGTVQCLPGISKRAGRVTESKPSQYHRERCSVWFDAYMKMVKPKKMLAFGNIAYEQITGKFSGVTKQNSTLTLYRNHGIVVPTVISVSPRTLNHGDSTLELITQSLDAFQNANERP